MSGRIIVIGADPLGVGAVALIAKEMADVAGATVDVVMVASAPAAGIPGGFVEEACLSGRADRVLVYEIPADRRPDGAFLADAVVDAAVGDDVQAVLFAETPFAREAAARVAVRLGGSCASSCSGPTLVPGEGLRVERPAYGGVATARLTLTAAPACVVLAAGLAAPAAAAGPPPSVEVRAVAVLAGVGRVSVKEETRVVKTCDLERAKVIVSVGRGFTKPTDLAIIDPLVELLGAEIGCSRPIAEDFKWLEKEHLVGLTGASVTPDVYLALGISGQVQHLAGIKGAKVVVAVNSDARSPIFKNADYGIVGDLFKVVPALTESLRGRRAAGGAGD
ncbi:MAG: electron transfer flavoprotein subunit alpha/FixB family protein [Thermoleophilia bacterium]